MSEKFNLEIISPDQTLMNTEVKQVTIPAYEGSMTILKDHISLITFLRPGFIEAEIENKVERFYVEEGTVEFFNNKLLILTSSTIKLDKLTKENIVKMMDESKIILQNTEIKDKEKYIINHKLETLQQISE
jgi:F-type H+-transporting ATPase subunit epsilon